ncbi:MAG: MraY family glycosyltransferase [Planctomycetia bacterium]|jgi:UDP-GlcNAc:undecaprenyl-phosphate GlcNAc-1-phosphate transferase
MLGLISLTLIAIGLSLLFVRLLISVAPRIGLVDSPDGRRKVHANITPVSGGIAIFGAVVVALMLGYFFVPDVTQVFLDHKRALSALACSCLLIVLVGAIDDRQAVPGKIKLLVQIAAALIIVYGGAKFSGISVFGYSLSLGWLAIPIALFWLVGCINAVNLLDGLDGMASTVGVVLMLTIGAQALFMDNWEVAVISFVFAGALGGFLVFNLPPAKIFLGDSGSMLIGLLAGTLSILGSSKSSSTMVIIVPVAIMTIPILDSSAALLRRKLTGRSMYDTDRNHLHHRLMLKVGCNWRVLFFVVVMSMVISGCVLTSIWLQKDFIALLGMFAVIIVLVATDTFGRNELRLLLEKYATSHRPREADVAEKNNGNAAGTVFHIQGNANWKMLWEDLLGTVHLMDTQSIHLDISLSSIHEEFVATWKNEQQCNRRYRWGINVPLVIDGQCYGRLNIEFKHEKGTARDHMEDILDLVSICKKYITDQLESANQDHHVPAGNFVPSPSLGNTAHKQSYGT